MSLPAFFLLVWFAKWPGKIERVALRLLGVGLVALMIAETRSNQIRWHRILEYPMGRAAYFYPDRPEVYQWCLRHLRPPDLLFGSPDLNLALNLRNPAPMDFLTPDDYTRPEQVQEVVEALEAKRARWVEWWPALNGPEGSSDHVGALRDCLRVHYHVAKTFLAGAKEILERNGQ